jgi:L-asparagine transporter-like permease
MEFSCYHTQTVGQARVLREVARQGLLPWSDKLASTKPLGTPLGPVLLKFILTTTVILLLPARDAFNFLLDVATYPHLVWHFFASESKSCEELMELRSFSVELWSLVSGFSAVDVQQRVFLQHH